MIAIDITIVEWTDGPEILVIFNLKLTSWKHVDMIPMYIVIFCIYNESVLNWFIHY